MVIPRTPSTLFAPQFPDTDFQIRRPSLDSIRLDSLRLTDAKGAVLHREEKVSDRARAVLFSSAGIVRDAPLPAGSYHARFVLRGIREGKSATVLELNRTVTLR